MHAAIGAGVFAASVLLFAWGYGAHNRPDARSWTKIEGISTGLCLLITGGVALAFTSLVAFAADYEAEIAQFDATLISVIALSVASCVFVAPRLMAPAWRTKADGGAPVVPLGPKGPGSQTPSGGKEPAKKAA